MTYYYTKILHTTHYKNCVVKIRANSKEEALGKYMKTYCRTEKVKTQINSPVICTKKEYLDNIDLMGLELLETILT